MATAAAEAPARLAYRIRANSVEACNCAHGCNCQFGGFPNEGKCESIIAYEVVEGRVGKVEMTGVRAVLVAKYPKAIHEGNGHVAVFIDEDASDEQVDALVSVFTGSLGGMPWEALAGTITRLDGPFRRPIEFNYEGTRSSVRVPGAVELQLEPLRNPVTGAEQDVHIVYPKGGFFWNDATIATTGAMSAKLDDLRLDWPAKYAGVAEVDWTNQG